MIDSEMITEAIEYILNHIWDGITLEEVASHCHMSVSRFSTVFKNETGESVYAFIKRMKMEQSASKLKMEGKREITDIGADYGYSASNYSSAFTQYHKKSPSVFRNELHANIPFDQKIIEDMNQKIRIETKPDYTVMYERTIGNYKDLEVEWCDFIERYRQDIDQDTIFFDRNFDDPTITNKDRCIYDICMTTRHPEKYKNTCILKGGKFVVYPFSGYIADILQTHQHLVGMWFPTHQYEIDDRYSYNQYRRVDANCYMEYDICIPIK